MDGAMHLRVMTFNIKNGLPTETNTWQDRRQTLTRVVLNTAPDVMGTQEGHYYQIKDMGEELEPYDWIGLGRAGGSKDEFMAIFYKKDRLEPVAFDHFWLSDTPDVVGSVTWGHNNIRMVTWVQFKDKATGSEFIHWNTHFDVNSAEARMKSARLLTRRIKDSDAEIPSVVTGDFNEPSERAVYEAMLEDGLLKDAWECAENRVGEGVGTWHGWKGLADNNSKRIDWILVSPRVECSHAEVVTYHENDQYPSDHFPVICDLILGED